VSREWEENVRKPAGLPFARLHPDFTSFSVRPATGLARHPA